MKKNRLLLLISFLVTGMSLYAASIPAKPEPVVPVTIKELMKLSPRQFQERTGKKLRFKEKIAYRLLQWKLRKQYRSQGEPTARQQRQGTLSLIFGIGALVILFLPYIGLLSVGLAIAGFILGIKSLKGNSNTAGLIGLIASSLVLFLFILALAVIATAFRYN